jgi:hypothetical protein
MGECTSGLKDCERALAIDKHWEKGHFRKGVCLLELGDHYLATNSFACAADLNPQNKKAKENIKKCIPFIEKTKVEVGFCMCAVMGSVNGQKWMCPSCASSFRREQDFIKAERDLKRSQNQEKPPPTPKKPGRSIMHKPTRAECCYIGCRERIIGFGGGNQVRFANKIALGNCVLKRCACRQVHYCSTVCQRADWERHRPDCKRLRSSAAGPDLRYISTSTIPELTTMLLVAISKYDVTPGEDRTSFVNKKFKVKVEEIGHRIYELGGSRALELMRRGVGETVRDATKNNLVRRTDAHILEVAWSGIGGEFGTWLH